MHQSPIIQPVHLRDLPLIEAHFARHVPESGNESLPFLPYAPNDDQAPRGLDPDRLTLTLAQPRWQRWFAAFVGHRDRIVGHVDLKGSALESGLHRCELSIGIESAYRNRGLVSCFMCRIISETTGCPATRRIPQVISGYRQGMERSGRA